VSSEQLINNQLTVHLVDETVGDASKQARLQVYTAPKLHFTV